MDIKRFVSLGVAALVTTPVAGATLSLMASEPSLAAKWCWCTEYVANRFGIRQYGHAGDWDNNTLPQAGFRRISGPQVGAIAVMERSFPGSDRSFGHVGVVERIRTSGGRSYIDLRGANQTIGNRFTEFGCNNVSVAGFATAVDGRGDISFWVRNQASSNPIREVNFTGRAAPAGVNVRSGPSLNSPVIGRLAPNQIVNFSGWTYGDVVTDIWLGTPDARWYRLRDQVNGQVGWAASGVIFGNAPGSTPMP